MEKEKKRRDLGEDVCQQDSKPKKIKHKAATDNGTTKLHEARYHRMPICHPKEYYHKMPKKREEIIRSFPMDHYGVQGQVPAAVTGSYTTGQRCKLSTGSSKHRSSRERPESTPTSSSLRRDC
jgi:hypothetical protein